MLAVRPGHDQGDRKPPLSPRGREPDSLLEGSPAGDAAYLAGSADGATAVFVAGELGKDLADAFGDKDVFILQ